MPGGFSRPALQLQLSGAWKGFFSRENAIGGGWTCLLGTPPPSSEALLSKEFRVVERYERRGIGSGG